MLRGAAMFDSDDAAATTLGPTEHDFQASHQPHAMTTTGSAILTLVLWRGPDLRGLSYFTTAAD